MLKKIIYSLLILCINIENLYADDLNEQFEHQYNLGFQDVAQCNLGLIQIKSLDLDLLKHEINTQFENFKNKKYATFCRQHTQINEFKAILVHTSFNAPKKYTKPTFIQKIDEYGIESLFRAQGRFYLIAEDNVDLSVDSFNEKNGFSVAGASFADAFSNLKYYLDFEKKEAFIEYINTDQDYKKNGFEKYLIEQFMNWLRNINCIDRIGLRTSENKLESILNELNFRYSVSYEFISGYESNYSLILR
ncbi:MAG: hypothetical protein Q8S31_08065 [Alphaproteobacteria bacterium]|nr:hypothetical protein [Alphaproteobacteria bacterium]